MDKTELETLLTPLLDQEGVELVDLQYAKEGPRWMVRLFLDKEGGITLDDCAYMSERVGALLDSSNAVNRAYVLEISSPGIDRVIKKDKDFERFSGQPVKLRLKAPQEGQRNFQGVLRGLKDGRVLLDIAGAVREFERPLVDQVRLDASAEI